MQNLLGVRPLEPRMSQRMVQQVINQTLQHLAEHGQQQQGVIPLGGGHGQARVSPQSSYPPSSTTTSNSQGNLHDPHGHPTDEFLFTCFSEDGGNWAHDCWRCGDFGQWFWCFCSTSGSQSRRNSTTRLPRKTPTCHWLQDCTFGCSRLWRSCEELYLVIGPALHGVSRTLAMGRI